MTSIEELCHRIQNQLQHRLHECEGEAYRLSVEYQDFFAGTMQRLAEEEGRLMPYPIPAALQVIARSCERIPTLSMRWIYLGRPDGRGRRVLCGMRVVASNQLLPLKIEVPEDSIFHHQIKRLQQFETSKEEKLERHYIWANRLMHVVAWNAEDVALFGSTKP